MYRIGYATDIHPLVVGRKLFLCGVNIPYDKGLLGHSDADVVIHAIAESILGALALGDLGKFFPDTDEKYKDHDSCLLLKEVVDMMENKLYEINNIDVTIIAEQPKLAPYINEMRAVISTILKVDVEAVSIKACTNEGLGEIGRNEAISAHCICLLRKKVK